MTSEVVGTLISVVIEVFRVFGPSKSKPELGERRFINGKNKKD